MSTVCAYADCVVQQIDNRSVCKPKSKIGLRKSPNNIPYSLCTHNPNPAFLRIQSTVLRNPLVVHAQAVGMHCNRGLAGDTACAHEKRAQKIHDTEIIDKSPNLYNCLRRKYTSKTGQKTAKNIPQLQTAGKLGPQKSTWHSRFCAWISGWSCSLPQILSE